MTTRTAYTNTITQNFSVLSTNDVTATISATLYQIYNTGNYTASTNKSQARLVIKGKLTHSIMASDVMDVFNARVFNYIYQNEGPVWTINDYLTTTEKTLLDQTCDITHNTNGQRAVELQIGSFNLKVYNVEQQREDTKTFSFGNTKVWFTSYNRTPTISVSSTAVDVGTPINVVASAPISNIDVYVVENGTARLLGNIASSSGTISYTCPTSLIANYTTQSYVPITFYGTNSVGTGSSVTKNFNIPSSYKPSVTQVTYTDVSATKPAKYSQLIQNISQLQCSVSAVGNTGSTIQSYTTNTGVNIYNTSSFTTQTLTATSYTFNTTVTDSRSRTSDVYTTTIQCDAYTLPIISSVNAYRCNSSGNIQADGTYARCVISYAISSLSDLNTKSLSVSVDGGASTSVALSNYTETNFDLWTNGFQPSGISATSGHTITFSLTDDFETYSISANISVAIPHIDFATNTSGDIGVGIGTSATVNRVTFSDSLPLYYGANNMDFVVEEGTSGIWKYRKWNNGTAQLWGSVTKTASIKSAWGNLYAVAERDRFARVNYPFTFVSVPTEMTYAHGGSSAFSMVTSTSADGWNFSNSTTKTAMYTLLRGEPSTSSISYTLSYEVIGKWK